MTVFSFSKTASDMPPTEADMFDMFGMDNEWSIEKKLLMLQDSFNRDSGRYMPDTEYWNLMTQLEQLRNDVNTFDNSFFDKKKLLSNIQDFQTKLVQEKGTFDKKN